ncbi:MAG: hypothetical protein QOH96_131 [Blastocatellia bacterium]|nr:hypothetical protein [Blastocatellia bacterium]
MLAAMYGLCQPNSTGDLSSCKGNGTGNAIDQAGSALEAGQVACRFQLKQKSRISDLQLTA